MDGNWKAIGTALKSRWNNEKQRGKWLMLLGIAGMLLILLSECSPEEGKPVTNISTQTLENEAYIECMEEKLVNLVEQVSGAGQCHVMLTLEQGAQYVYASENKTVLDETQSHDGAESKKIQQKDNSESKIVVLEENGISRPLVETSREPQVKGVVVVCEGGSSSIVQQRITELLTTVLGISSNQVCVVPRK